MPSSFPKRVILSRKGWDSKAGGYPSPILPDGTMISLPIPDRESGIRYCDLRWEYSSEPGRMVENLSHLKVGRTDELHLDPDLSSRSVQRREFRAAFGQCGAAQSHLHNQGVRKETAAEDGDLFLFFGLYRPVTEREQLWRYTTVQSIHAFFGWLQVGQVIHLATEKAPSELARHPHVVRSFIVRQELGRQVEDNNTLYVARSTLSFESNLPGAGLFSSLDINDFEDPRRLTCANQTCSRWRLPSFFRKLSNMGSQPTPKDSWWYPQRRGPGQEFVLGASGCEDELKKWLTRVFMHAPRAKAAKISR
jgi:hypothetical protein